MFWTRGKKGRGWVNCFWTGRNYAWTINIWWRSHDFELSRVRGPLELARFPAAAGSCGESTSSTRLPSQGRPHPCSMWLSLLGSEHHWGPKRRAPGQLCGRCTDHCEDLRRSNARPMLGWCSATLAGQLGFLFQRLHSESDDRYGLLTADLLGWMFRWICDFRGNLSLKEITTERKNNGPALLEMGAARRPDTLAWPLTSSPTLAPSGSPNRQNHHLRGQAIQFVNKGFGNLTESSWRAE